MNKKDYVLRNARIKKWVEARKGRMPLLGQLVGKDRASLYNLIHENKMSPDLVHLIEEKQLEIEAMEKDCIKRFPSFRRFILKGEGRVQRLAEKVNLTARQLRDLAYSKEDGRYLLMKHGVDRIMNAIRECEREKANSSYSHEKLDIRAFLSTKVKKSHHSLDDIINLAGLIKEHADFGNHDAAVICREVKPDQYKVLSVGFDSVFSDMCKSHVCEKKNPHLHASMFAALNVPKQSDNATNALVLFSHSAPCPNCAPRLVSIGLTKAYCYYEAEFMGGLELLAKHDIPVIKINAYSKTYKRINGAAIAAA
ncbi:tRNA(Arg) A34 adenosine deaminase TadA [Acinetobacter lwoffii]|jgi:tRNA(Arg) A34 adenosine deaminase TadA|uniref:tRNA(Arg) A34 adenosine deaminase TadA n=1 Tax=Acinetobacter lwoffii TaxID=28090 RepID=A0AAW8LF77_ACILW|nr:hypothetical protein [Acinetobacter lwoffii]MDR6630448.1 tRNA(Arg) A34 adenosine deaminase TadA [Acinetobacter lwoffii]